MIDFVFFCVIIVAMEVYMAVNKEEKYQELLFHLNEFLAMENKFKMLGSRITDLNEQKDVRVGEHNYLMRRLEHQKVAAHELLKYRLSLSTLIVASISFLSTFFGSMWIGNLFNISSDINLLLMGLTSSLGLVALESYCMYTRKANNTKYLDMELLNDREYQSLLQKIDVSDKQIERINLERELTSQSKENIASVIKSKRDTISELISELAGQDDANGYNVKDNQKHGVMARKRVKSE